MTATHSASATDRAAERIAELSTELRRHAERYFRDDRPEISDSAWDRLMDELRALEFMHPELILEDSPGRAVGFPVIGKQPRGVHPSPMLSLDAAHSREDLEKFDNYVRSTLAVDAVEYVLEPKLDGIAIEACYSHGRLEQVLTRGNGLVGEDVTNLARASHAFPLSLPMLVGATRLNIVIRGEVVMPKTAYVRLARIISDCGGEPYAGIRHATAASLRQRDSRVTALRGLRFLAHELLDPIPIGHVVHRDSLGWLRRLGLPVANPTYTAEGLGELLTALDELEAQRPLLPWETDGTVIKVSNLAWRSLLGAGTRTPNWAIAYKPLATEN